MEYLEYYPSNDKDYVNSNNDEEGTGEERQPIQIDNLEASAPTKWKGLQLETPMIGMSVGVLKPRRPKKVVHPLANVKLIDIFCQKRSKVVGSRCTGWKRLPWC